MKKTISLLLALVTALSVCLLSSCGGESEDLSLPEVQAEKLGQLMSNLEELTGLTLDGSCYKIEGADGTRELSVSGAVALSGPDPRFSGTVILPGQQPMYAYYKDKLLHLYSEHREGGEIEKDYERIDVSQKLDDIGISSLFEKLDADIAKLLSWLSNGKKDINGALAEAEKGYTCDDLLALAEVWVGFYKSIAGYLGHTSTVTVPAHNGTVGELVNDVMCLEKGENGGYILQFSSDWLYDIAAELITAAKSYGDRNISIVLDLVYGEGTVSSIVSILNTIKGTDTVASAAEKLRGALAILGLTENDVYTLLAPLAANASEAEITAEDLRELVESSGGMTVNAFIDAMYGGMTWTMVANTAKSYLTSKTLAEVYAGLTAATGEPEAAFHAAMDAYAGQVRAVKDLAAVSFTVRADKKLSITELALSGAVGTGEPGAPRIELSVTARAVDAPAVAPHPDLKSEMEKWQTP